MDSQVLWDIFLIQVTVACPSDLWPSNSNCFILASKQSHKNTFFPILYEMVPRDILSKWYLLHHFMLHKTSFTPWNKKETIMLWQPSSTDLKPTENMRSILKRKIYKSEQQFTGKQQLWVPILTSPNEIQTSIHGPTDETVRLKMI